MEKEWDAISDTFDIEKFISSGYAELKRGYIKETPGGGLDYLEMHDSNGKLVPLIKTVAKGITAFLSYRDGIENVGLSYRDLKCKNSPSDLENKIFPKYLKHCLFCLEKQEKIKHDLISERRPTEELLSEHINNEEIYFNESSIFFKDVLSREAVIIDNIKKHAMYYPQWVKKTYLTGSNSSEESNSKSKTSPFPNDYNIDQLKKIFTRSKGIIKCLEVDFLYWFGGIGESGQQLKWTKMRGKSQNLTALYYYCRKLNPKATPSMINIVFGTHLKTNNANISHSPSFSDIDEIFNNL